VFRYSDLTTPRPSVVGAMMCTKESPYTFPNTQRILTPQYALEIKDITSAARKSHCQFEIYKKVLKKNIH